MNTNDGSDGVFLCKSSASNGNILALKAIWRSNCDTSPRTLIDNQSNVSMIGNYIGSYGFDGILTTGTDNTDIFIVKCSSQWISKLS